ncbi:hypothetical protein COL64_06715 [Bacillus toyonensis]|uniref:hypothetical protein n=1 Tax=Bacillus toyonensis TaxID=155322 RepID=UPI000BEE5B90|nr:hypothetical protein [Bacillus toyonensis]PED91601.1 hypothetical protein CON90_25920 [Bacillus toyonensis]PEK43908.1 hypothetical protein CN588_23245 [Bacillus toyonensis]PEL63111.1 hypothetical protein CN633_05330 [Bacillus toyonensis]PFZ39120.1 hypothetical protein COL64_06715 [Bacillus toyonensis]
MKKTNTMRDNIKKIYNDGFLKECFHRDENCFKKIIKAHSIQNNRILNKISENGEVLMFGDDDEKSWDFKFSMQRVGRRKATTFTGFCGKHDTEIFKKIERKNYEIGNKEQDFLFAYRALAKEYHSKITVGNMYREMSKYLKNEEYEKLTGFFKDEKPTLEHIDFMASMLKNLLVYHEDAEERLEIYKKRMNSFLDSAKFDEIITEVIELDEEYHIAVSSTTFIERDLEGKTINEIANLDATLAPLFITAFPQEGKTYILLSYFERNKKRYKFIGEQILAKNNKMQKIIISNLIVAYLENWAVSPIKWNKLSSKMKAKINKYYTTTMEEDKLLLYDKNMNLFI